jgi:hypothetical protein
LYLKEKNEPFCATESDEQFEGVIRLASIEILLLLNAFRGRQGSTLVSEQLDIARLSMGGWGAVAKRLKLNDAELTQFTLQLRHLQQVVPHYERGKT